jgi:hypothetical protein
VDHARGAGAADCFRGALVGAHSRLAGAREDYLRRTTGRAWGRPVNGTESPYLLTGLAQCGSAVADCSCRAVNMALCDAGRGSMPAQRITSAVGRSAPTARCYQWNGLTGKCSTRSAPICFTRLCSIAPWPSCEIGSAINRARGPSALPVDGGTRATRPRAGPLVDGVGGWRVATLAARRYPGARSTPRGYRRGAGACDRASNGDAFAALVDVMPEARRRLQDWQTVLIEETAQARQMLRTLLEARIVFTPRPELPAVDLLPRGLRPINRRPD